MHSPAAGGLQRRQLKRNSCTGTRQARSVSYFCGRRIFLSCAVWLVLLRILVFSKGADDIFLVAGILTGGPVSLLAAIIRLSRAVAV